MCVSKNMDFSRKGDQNFNEILKEKEHKCKNHWSLRSKYVSLVFLKEPLRAHIPKSLSYSRTLSLHTWHLEILYFLHTLCYYPTLLLCIFFKFSNHFLGFVVLLTLSQSSCRPISEAMSLRKFFLESQDESIGPHYAFRALYKYLSVKIFYMSLQLPVYISTYH